MGCDTPGLRNTSTPLVDIQCCVGVGVGVGCDMPGLHNTSTPSLGNIIQDLENILQSYEHIFIKLWKYYLGLASGYKNIYKAVKIFHLA